MTEARSAQVVEKLEQMGIVCSHLGHVVSVSRDSMMKTNPACYEEDAYTRTRMRLNELLDGRFYFTLRDDNRYYLDEIGG